MEWDKPCASSPPPPPLTSRVRNRQVLLLTTRNALWYKYFKMEEKAGLSSSQLCRMKTSFRCDTKNLLIQNICSRYDPLDVSLDKKVLERTNHVYTHKVYSFIISSLIFIHVSCDFPANRGLSGASDTSVCRESCDHLIMLM